MTLQEEVRRKEAKKLIKNFYRDNPANVHFTPAKRLAFAVWAVELDNMIVYFQDDGKKLYYSGERSK